ncbi:MAG: tetratricopeptide repeat protein [bacterium]|nr:tetratricopeptide repeat protein [bacterium]
MKKKLLLLFLLMPCFLKAESLSVLFKQGNELYKQGKYDEAAKQYELILSKNVENGYVYFNLGNAYWKANNIGKAVLNYERARIYLPTDSDIRFNLKFANSIKQDKIEEPEYNPFTRIILAVYDIFELNTLFWLVYVLFLVLAASLIFKWFSRNINHQVLNARIFSNTGIVFLLLLFILIIKIYDVRSSTYAVILNSEVKIKSGPDETYTDIFSLHTGSKVRISKESGNWFLITLPNGYSGWLDRNSLEKI